MTDTAPGQVDGRLSRSSSPMPRRVLLLFALVFDLVFIGMLAAYTLLGPFSAIRVVGLVLAAIALVLLNALLPRPIRHQRAAFWLLVSLLGAGIAMAGRGPAGAGFGLSRRQACLRLDALDAQITSAADAGATPNAVQQVQHIASQLRSLRAKTLLPSVRQELTFQIGWAESSARALQQPGGEPPLGLGAYRVAALRLAELLHQQIDMPSKNVCSAS